MSRKRRLSEILEDMYKLDTIEISKELIEVLRKQLEENELEVSERDFDKILEEL
jgi:16S rRNA A1518/A1519 N6-dimethyltransferase RsmA/KsgA/DIM1 with predicted DNA glycosylase/AP lyase activity